MNIGEAMTATRKKLTGHPDIENPSLESEVMLRYVLNVGRAHLHSRPESELKFEDLERLDGWIERRLKGEPLAYIVGWREFFGRYFKVDGRVLIPRPETELLVDAAIAFYRDNKVKTAADIGTGSGAVAISLHFSLPGIKVYASDISPDALDVARMNADTYKAGGITFLRGDLLEPLPEAVDIIIANLPYVRREDMAQVNTLPYEPELALDGGESGLEKIKQLCYQLPGKINPGGCVFLEIGLGQSGELTAFIKGLFPKAKVEVLKDLALIDRVVKIVF